MTRKSLKTETPPSILDDEALEDVLFGKVENGTLSGARSIWVLGLGLLVVSGSVILLAIGAKCFECLRGIGARKLELRGPVTHKPALPHKSNVPKIQRVRSPFGSQVPLRSRDPQGCLPPETSHLGWWSRTSTPTASPWMESTEATKSFIDEEISSC